MNGAHAATPSIVFGNRVCVHCGRTIVRILRDGKWTYRHGGN